MVWSACLSFHNVAAGFRLTIIADMVVIDIEVLELILF
jgi:hypothetical protein